MKTGYVPALGTPLDKDGNFLPESYRKQIEDQLQAGATGVLVMGSMGMEASIRNDEYAKVVRTAVEAVAGRVPVFVGAMDNAIARAKERMAAVENLDIDAFVFTAPFYFAANPAQAVRFFKGVAAQTKHGMMLYDLPSVTQFKISYDLVLQLLREIPNLVGIKSADLQLMRRLRLNPEVPENFIMVYSGLDTVDIAYRWGIERCLDGMFSCTPVNCQKLMNALEAGDAAAAAKYLDNIVGLRDLFVKQDLWPSFTAAMNLKGYAGSHQPDYMAEPTERTYGAIRAALEQMGEL